MRRFIDIGANLTDPQFRGVYRNSRKHADDLASVLARAKLCNVFNILVTGSNLEESRAALDLCRQYPGYLASTVGVHPCHANDVPLEDPIEFAKYVADVESLAKEGKKEGHVRAFGEIGLDYDRLHYAGEEQQKRVFQIQLDLACKLGLPLFLHSRNAAADFHAMIQPYMDRLNGVVHSFTGSSTELHDLLSLGLFIGVNGCSLKTEDNLSVCKQIPLAKIMLETDGPWCEIRKTHASHHYTKPLPFEYAKKPEKWVEGQMVRGRCEPCAISNVAEVVAAVHNVSEEKVIEHAFRNAENMFFRH